MRITRRKLLINIPVPFAAVVLWPLANAQAISTEHILGGTPSAPVRIEVFSDFQCSACRAFFLQTIKQVLRDYCAENKVCVIYHEFPLRMHQFSRLAARYSLASQRLGQSQWLSVMDALYTNQSEWAVDGNIDVFVAKALSADDMQKVRQLVAEASINDAVNSELTLASQKEITYTPTFFLYAGDKEQKVVGALEYTVLKEYIDRLIK